MGIQTILSAKRILLMAWGTNKSEIIQKAIEGSISPMIPTTYLQLHKNTTLVLRSRSCFRINQNKNSLVSVTVSGMRHFDQKQSHGFVNKQKSLF